MTTYLVKPLVGVGPVRLGMTSDMVRQVMLEMAHTFRKTPDSRYAVDAFHESAFQVHYGGERPIVEFIELMRGSELQVRCLGIEVFSTPVDELIALFGEHGAYDQNNPELPYSYIFPDLQLSCWRSTIPETEDDDGGRYFDTIAVWKKGYYDSQ